MPRARKTEKSLLQVRLSETDKRRIKSLAARHGLTVQQAVVEAFAAWAKMLRADGRNPTRADSQNEKLPSTQPPSSAWLNHIVQLDWTKCPAVELLEDGTNRVWVLRESDIPLIDVLSVVADGLPPAKIAEIFGLQPSQLANVIEFARPAHQSDALNWQENRRQPTTDN